jgi:nucleoside-diphosphate-sugar epimerase
MASTAVLRFAGLIGPGRHPARFLAAKKGVPAPNAPVNLIHLDDCCGIIETIIEKRLEGTFNACAPSHPARREFYEIACSHLGIAPPEFDETDESAGREISIVKLLEETGYNFIHSDLYKALDHCL